MTDPTIRRGDGVTGITDRSDLDTLAAVLDPDCQRILATLGTAARTAPELADACDLPTSTTYRKLDKLCDAGVVEEGVRVRTAGKPASEYQLTPTDVCVSVTSDGDIVVDRQSD
ncbi:ArsR/SmtB family transcription factor [Haloarchaeobius amylolyticus]|uniref:ArsR/SmtB family transcription factor n=1 Tax=Haloarchaeobius amylolyticus TaxID=1198296 RepID=UPI002270D3F5|nr:helix-turn-helix domain-containing protein [Haloarchaeobius amylolyticus]